MKSRQHSVLLGAPKHCIPDIQYKKPSPLTILTQRVFFFIHRFKKVGETLVWHLLMPLRDPLVH